MNEYNYVNGPASSYMKIVNYNNAQSSIGSVESPYVPPTTSTGAYIVPDYKTIGYDALTNGEMPNGAGYYDITNGYGRDAANCNTQFFKLSCGDNIKTPEQMNAFRGSGRNIMEGLNRHNGMLNMSASKAKCKPGCCSGAWADKNCGNCMC